MALRGTLSETEPADLLQILALGGKTGVLTVVHQGRAVTLIFRSGDIIHATDGTRQGEEVVLALLAQHTGSFTFSTEPVSGEQTVHRTVPGLLLVAAQRVDDLERANGLLNRPSARMVVAEGVDPVELGGLGEAEGRLLELVDGRRSVGEIVAGGGGDLSRTYALLAGLIERGVLTVVTAEEEQNPLLSPAGELAGSNGPGRNGGAGRPTAQELREVAAYLRQAAGCAPGGGG